MTAGRTALALFAALAGPLAAQTVEIYSEFERVDPFGGIVAADRGARPREILSPALARNAWASFHVVVTAPPNTTYLLYFAINPLDACRVDLYREHFVKTAAGWVPDRLTPLQQLPDFGFISDPDDGVDGQNMRVYLLDLWIPPTANVGRFRAEVQLRVGYWVIRPMEIRVIAARVPDLQVAGEPTPLPPVEAGADAAVLGPLLNYLDSTPGRTYTAPTTVRGIIRRNAVQDMALAATLDADQAGPDAVRQLWRTFVWSGARWYPNLVGAEWYLRVRDRVYAAAAR